MTLKRYQKIAGLIAAMVLITALYIFSYPGAQTIFGGQIRSITSDVQGYNFEVEENIPINIEVIPYSELPNSYQTVGVYSLYVDGEWVKSGGMNVENNERTYSATLPGLDTGVHDVVTKVAIMPYTAFDGCDNSFAHCGYSSNDHICPWQELFTERLPCEAVEEAGWDSNYGVNPNSNIDWFQYNIEWYVTADFTETVVVGDIQVISAGEYQNLLNQISQLSGDIDAQAQTIDNLQLSLSEKQALIENLQDDLDLSEQEKQALAERIDYLESQKGVFEQVIYEIQEFFAWISGWFSSL